MSRVLSEEKERSPCLEDSCESGSSSGSMLGARRNVALDVLLALWGLGTWLGVNGLFMQLPLLVQVLPEGWKLPSGMAVAIQCANVGLLAYGSLRKVTRVSDAACIYGLLALGALALYLNAFLYPRTALVAGSERSVAFLALTFCVALVGCTSSVLFYPYLRHYRELYLATYLVGEGLSGFVPSALALAQGVGGEPECVLGADNATLVPLRPAPRFGTTVYVSLLGGLATLSLLAFCAIHNYPGFAAERVKEGAVAKEEEAASARASGGRWVLMMALMTVLNAVFNGVLPSVQSYSCMPYGARAYHLAVTLGSMANPAACLAGVWLRPVRARWLALMLAAAALLLAFILTTALQSPAPPLHTQTLGAVLVVGAWVACSGGLSYARMWVYGWARRGGARGMRACGALGQLGSALGSLLLFALVNYTALFQEAPACPARPL